jgi:hypothetical protein
VTNSPNAGRSHAAIAARLAEMAMAAVLTLVQQAEKKERNEPQR